MHCTALHPIISGFIEHKIRIKKKLACPSHLENLHYHHHASKHEKKMKEKKTNKQHNNNKTWSFIFSSLNTTDCRRLSIVSYCLFGLSFGPHTTNLEPSAGITRGCHIFSSDSTRRDAAVMRIKL